MSGTDSKAARDLTEIMEKTMQSLQGRFQALSEQMVSKNEMGMRIDGLEKNVADLMSQAGMDEQPDSK